MLSSNLWSGLQLEPSTADHRASRFDCMIVFCFFFCFVTCIPRLRCRRSTSPAIRAVVVLAVTGLVLPLGVTSYAHRANDDSTRSGGVLAAPPAAAAPAPAPRPPPTSRSLHVAPVPGCVQLLTSPVDTLSSSFYISYYFSLATGYTFTVTITVLEVDIVVHHNVPCSISTMVCCRQCSLVAFLKL